MTFLLDQTFRTTDGPEGTRSALPMLRPFKERLVQSLGFEISGLVLSLPLLSYFSNASPFENVVLLAVLSAVVMLWSAVHNMIFDAADLHLTGRVASERPLKLRVVHALSHEFSSILVSLPVLIIVAGFDIRTALFVDLWLTLIYAVWAWAYYWAWDRLRPLDPATASETVGART